MGIKSYLENSKNYLEKKQEEFKNNEKAEYGAIMKSSIMAIVAIVVVFILASAILPGAFNSTASVGTSTWPTGAQTMWTVLIIFGVLAVLLIIIGIALKAADL